MSGGPNRYANTTITMYQDRLTKFALLRALQTKRTDAAAHQLTDIFDIWSTFYILHSNNAKVYQLCYQGTN